MLLVTVILVVGIGTVASYTTPSPCTIRATWKDKNGNNCDAYKTKSWCVSEKVLKSYDMLDFSD